MKHFTINAENNITVHASQEARETNNAVFSTEEQLADAIGNDNTRLIDIFNGLPGVTPVKKFANRKIATERIWKAIQSLGGPAAAQDTDVMAGFATAEVAQSPQTGPTPESVATPATSEPPISAAEQQPEPAVASQTQEPCLAPVEAAQQATPFDEPVASIGAQGADVAAVDTKATKKASRAKKTPTVEANAGVPREGSKTSHVIEMLKREGGATLDELMKEFGWQQHTTRSLMSAGGALAKKHGLVVTSQKVGDKRTYFVKA